MLSHFYWTFQIVRFHYFSILLNLHMKLSEMLIQCFINIDIFQGVCFYSNLGPWGKTDRLIETWKQAL